MADTTESTISTSTSIPTPTPTPTPSMLREQHVSDLHDIGAVLLSQGAEARTFRYMLNGLDCIVKERFEKKYRHPLLDAKIANKRILMEVRAINRCRKNGISVPCLYLTDTLNNRIYMEYIDGITIKQHLYNHSPPTNNPSGTPTVIIEMTPDKQKEIETLCFDIGLCIGRMHNIDIIHGDLTTSNMLLKSSSTSVNNNNNNNQNNNNRNNINNDNSDLQLKDEKSIIFIDFGLSYSSTLVEDRAVDLYVLERAFISTHPNSEPLFKKVMEGYESSSPKAKNIVAKLDQVRLRGRKKLAFG
ncbi:putative protein serine/threonine kinase [Cavenderia fasciculata]|uniref:non-specific serine/threonine protein kinase n=1 Tax=Cavenderia fasciculata TaxID=261658 RepID=F4PKG1_CACFS|nr:putative protein serine/threonine kinase [Cavenderia fasciculata]EGG24085.1 putative protein serine/threonine kinase [Cavenderia fasciculata]|eukprot:XP_004361936.1 putative protein serine/threonine kinase [Cavenderia fasciculata]